MLSEDANTAVVAVYAGLVATLDHLLGGDADLGRFPEDAVLQAAIAELRTEARDFMVEWLLRNAEWAENAAAVLDQMDELEDPFPPLPPAPTPIRRRPRRWWRRPVTAAHPSCGPEWKPPTSSRACTPRRIRTSTGC
ncbi:hypothetical protein MMAGJ_12410 [Mycolicibacterium mageritense]|uniref:Uncharacterized protein n=1 Tax=Mycolicibacterium mageritense TaxID=53462 RepID=A0ABN5Y144_MYCME|nr:hypothetical protein MMAGJ_12410 [Mycolicibacterium mageritense]